MPNPMFRDNIVQETVINEGQMTIQGAVAKTFSLICFMLVSATYTWYLAMSGMLDKVNMFTWGGVIVGFIAVIIASFRPSKSNIFAPIYAIAEGFALGGISAIYNSFYEGIIIQAVVATIVTLLAMLFLYSTRLIQATDKFKRIVFTATLSIGLFYLIVMAASFFHIQFLSPFINAYNNVFVICFIIIIAAFNLIVDFDFIEAGSRNFMPKYFEWYGAMGLMVTLVWLYLEFLRLLSRRK